MATWLQVTRRNPCPICGHDHWCSITQDGSLVACYRIDNGNGISKVDASGSDFWLYRMKSEASVDFVDLPKPIKEIDRAEPVVLNNVYTALLDKLCLSVEHKANLKARSLDDEAVVKNKYKTLPQRGRSDLARYLTDLFSSDTCLKVPGFYMVEKDGKTWPSFAGAAGIVIPVRNAEGLIIALKVRADEDTEDCPRYTSISSKTKGGPGPGAQIHVPLFTGDTSTIRLTEGELKADIATNLSNILTIATPGVSAFRLSIPVIKELGATKVLLSFDSDANENPHVAKALHRAAQSLASERFEVLLETWPSEYGKGIDDVLNSGLQTELIAGNEIWSAIESTAKAAGVEVDALAVARELFKGFREQAAIKPGDAIREALESPKTLGALALVLDRDRGTFEAGLMSLREQGVLRRDLDSLKSAVSFERRSLKSSSDTRSTVLRLVKPGEEPSLLAVKSILEDAPVPDETVIPTKFSLTYSGVFIGKETEAGYTQELIAPSPIVIAGRLSDITNGTESLRLAWRRDGRWKYYTISRSKVANVRTIVELAGVGFPVTSNNAANLVRYIAEFEASNIDILPTAKVTSKLGWQGKEGSLGFLWGHTLIQPNGECTAQSNVEEVTPIEWCENTIAFRGADGGDEQIASGFYCDGTYEDWLEAVALAARFPKAILSLYAALAPSLLTILGSANFCCDWSGPTSLGKTTTLRIGASCWGNPDETSSSSVLWSWDATRVWIERAATVLNGLPLILDDTKRARTPEMVAKVLYDFAGGRGRGRGTTQGISHAGTWKTVLLSTGEAPATSFTNDGGTRSRTLTVWGSPFGHSSMDTASLVNRLSLGLKQNFGYAGPKFVAFLLRNKADWPLWRDEFKRAQKQYLDFAGSSNVGARLAEYFAVLNITAGLAHAALKLPWAYEDPVESLWEDLLTEASEADRARDALHVVMSWAYGNAHLFWGRHEEGNEKRLPSGGWAGQWDSKNEWEQIGFLPHRLNEILRNHGFEADAVLRTWKDREWLSAGSDRKRLQKKVRIDSEPTWMFVIKRSAIDEVDR